MYRRLPLVSRIFVGVIASVGGLLALGVGARPAAAQALPAPDDAANVDFFLLTVGRGPSVDSNYGHTILRLVDRVTGADLNFNWGIFDFLAPGFAWKFYQGNLRYQMAVMDWGNLIRHYRQVERRSVVQDQVNLSTAQKAVLLKRLAWNMQPENVEYDYNQFWNNCATRPRDYLDEALGGRIKAKYARPSHMVFRQMIRAASSAATWSYFGLDMVTNDRFDMPILEWDEMFLPAKLREHLRELPAWDDSGTPIAGQNLLSNTRVIVDLPEARDGTNPYYIVMLFFGVPLLGLLAYQARVQADVTSVRRRARALGAACIAFGLWSGFIGTLLLANWLLSNYPEGKHNAGLWFLWPTDWLLVAYGVTLIREGRPVYRRWIDLGAKGHLIGVILVAALWTFGVFLQDVSAMLATSGVLAVAVYGALLGIRPGQSQGDAASPEGAKL